MGVPKFFRYISERYPCLSEIVKEYQIPEFDNLYLDMNGIIHMCSHPDDADPHFRISEEKIFTDIFHYIEVLFRMIKPRKLFFMAVDGVAPRAKMNQQRGRRFRSAKEAQTSEAKALERGEVLPTEARFDSNCITPGTVFMANLHEQLKYFIVNKISTDALWRNCKIILSGHETPGEGEHKIMDYIRYMRAQPGYDPNTRHCLYGLDADLIMLGLCTHEPHFSLLREEVRFGKKSNKRKNIPEQITFYLLHLSLMREYLELEFLPLKSSLKFEYDMEKIIDDWVLMGFLVGNDFIPHLPNMHIDGGALPVLYRAYMKVLPQLGGYINEAGTLNLSRFEIFIKELGNIDIKNFSDKYADLKWFEAKRLEGKKIVEENGHVENGKKGESDYLLDLESAKKDIIKCMQRLKCEPQSPQDVEEESDLINSELDHNEFDVLISESESQSEEDDELFQAEFIQHKTDYYMNKLEYENVNEEVLKSQTKEYIRAIQWNLHYYYNGVCSWSWYYPHHYAPYISDIKDFADLKFEFELGKPFQPYEQLLAVLPAASRVLLPLPYQKLMTEDDSLIKMYYPEEFKTDLNGKRMEWEAVVLIPFIEEELLLQAMESCNLELTGEEVERNTHGPMLVYRYTPENMQQYNAPKYFPTITASHAKCETVNISDIRVPIENLVKGAYPGAKFDVYYPGFPTLKHLEYTASLKKAKVRVFEQPSRYESMILQITQPDDELPQPDAFAKDLLGTSVHVGWPHLVEALAVGISTNDFKYHSTGQIGQYNVVDNKSPVTGSWKSERNAIVEHYQNRLGINVGKTEMLVHVKLLTGRKYIFKNNKCIALEKQWTNVASAYPLQTVVHNIRVYEEKFASYNNIEDLFPVGSQCFMLGHPCYGALGEVIDSTETLKNGRIKLCMKKQEEPDLSPVRHLDHNIAVRFMNIHMASTKLAISKNLFGRITGTIFLIPQKSPDLDLYDVPRTNIGLNLKFNKRNEEIPGYTRKDGNVWYYSEKAVELVGEYMARFPKVFEYLNFHAGKDVYEEHKMFPTGDVKEQIREITTWIKQQPYYSIERQVTGSSIIDPEAVKLLEKVVDQFAVTNTNSKQIVMQVKPHLLYKHSLQVGYLAPDPATTYELYDRVINVREGFTVPMGYKGTITAIHKPNGNDASEGTFDVVFDKPFAGGLSINGSSNRAYQMTKPSIINISYGLRVFEEKSGKPGQLQNMQNQHTRNDVHNNMNFKPNQFNQPPAFGQWFPNNNNYYPHPPAHAPITPFNPNPNFSAPPNFPPTYNPTYNQTGHSFVPYKTHFALSPGPPQYFPPGPMPAPEPKLNERRDNYPVHKANMSPDKNKVMLRPEFWQPPPRNTPQSSARNEKKLVLTPDDVFAHARATQQNIAKQSVGESVPTADTTPNLLYNTAKVSKEFQIRGLGCPNYQYFALKDGNFVASLTMANGDVLVGKPAKSKDQAAENTAVEALTTLYKDEKVNSSLPQMVPPKPPMRWQNPPYNNQGSPQKQWAKPQERQHTENWRTERHDNSKNYVPADTWRQPGNQQQTQSRTRVNADAIHRYLHNDAEMQSKTHNTMPGNAPFIPLQAVRQQRSRTTSSTTETVLKENTNANFPPQKQEVNVPTAQLVTDLSPTVETVKPKRERKMRIAANFQMASE
ncbi:hypothetical protein PPYR_09446 [Photinus pyralis]|uniref:5'-3' exoribonuclease 1 n=1 Tax=Photinus pyralis TaxID=7054 RepID=A0A5N4AMG4_PHOPY|nr:5'-3' exoribonuclease 1 [Photinus pyralis]KAB0798453.1 hypothetical protein PPYR_09446 [Photinus pyralis]